MVIRFGDINIFLAIKRQIGINKEVFIVLSMETTLININRLPGDVINRIESNVHDLQVIDHRNQFEATLTVIKNLMTRSVNDRDNENENRCCIDGDIGWTCWFKGTGGTIWFNGTLYTNRWNRKASVYCLKHGNYFNKHK